jgi:hypothetical protein
MGFKIAELRMLEFSSMEENLHPALAELFAAGEVYLPVRTTPPRSDKITLRQSTLVLAISHT